MKSSAEEIRAFDGAPGPSPWYLHTDPPKLAGFRWRDAGRTIETLGKTLLVGPEGPVAIFGFYNYVCALDGTTLLVWNQRHVESASTAPVSLMIVKLKELTPLSTDLEVLCANMRRKDAFLYFEGGPSDRVDLATTNVSADISAVFPMELRAKDELLILCRSSGIRRSDPSRDSNLALLVARPRDGSYRLYPQDWFNAADFDFGYQWVTRVVRHPTTGRVHGEGFRLEPFVLDDSLRALRT